MGQIKKEAREEKEKNVIHISAKSLLSFRFTNFIFL
jgi:hypothetical protein